jgi:membrane-bound lytic murein transglycosylase MltF
VCSPSVSKFRYRFASAFLFAIVVTAAACGGGGESTSSAGQPEPTSAAATSAPQEAEEPLPPSELETQLPSEVREALLKPFTGDFDAMVERRLVRVGVTFNRTLYFVDRGVQRGVVYEYGRLMEDTINEHLKTGNIKVHVLFVPLSRDKLLSALVDGKVDIAAGNLTITPEREKLVDFTDPTRTNVSEILVTPPNTPPIASVEDLSGKTVFVRRSSSYYQSLAALNKNLEASGKAPVTIEAAPENLEDDDLLEMVNAELIPAVIVDDFMAQFWKKVFPGIVLHENVAVRSGGNLGVAIRKDSPQLKAALNKFMGKNGLGTAFGNTIERRYLVNTSYAKNAASEAERKKFLAVVQLFRKYSDQYDLDFLLMAAQGYQESRLDQGAKSHVGAIGIMQVMPATGKELNVGDITQLEPNIHAGVKYMRRVMDANFNDPGIDRLNRGLLTFASYNAGPGRVRQLRREAEKRGLDPNLWFGNVEQIASERIGRETVTYVSNIYKYYVAYRLISEENDRRANAKATLKEEVAK